MMFLTAADLRILVGPGSAKTQAKFLRDRHIKHFVNRAGKVVVMKEWLVGGEKPQASIEPNFGALR